MTRSFLSLFFQYLESSCNFGNVFVSDRKIGTNEHTMHFVLKNDSFLDNFVCTIEMEFLVTVFKILKCFDHSKSRMDLFNSHQSDTRMVMGVYRECLSVCHILKREVLEF